MLVTPITSTEMLMLKSVTANGRDFCDAVKTVVHMRMYQ